MLHSKMNYFSDNKMGGNQKDTFEIVFEEDEKSKEHSLSESESSNNSSS